MEEQAQIDRAAIGRRGAEVTNSRPPLALAIKADPTTIEQIMHRSLHGEKLGDIAKDYGVSKQALQQQIIRHAPDEWRDTQAARSMVAYEEARDRLDEPLDALDIARVREQVRSRQWELERLIPRLYGQKQEVTVTHKSDLAERIQAAERRIIDVTPEKDASTP